MASSSWPSASSCRGVARPAAPRTPRWSPRRPRPTRCRRRRRCRDRRPARRSLTDSNPCGERTDPMQRHTKVLAGVLALSLLGAACGDDDDDTETGTGDAEAPADIPDGPAISIGAQDFGESLILAEIYDGVLDDAGYEVDIQEVGGFRDLLFGAFESGEVNLAPDYLASQLEFLNEGAGQATSDAEETLGLVEPLLTEKGLVGLTPSEAVITNAFVVT